MDSISSTQGKKPDNVARACNPGPEKIETDRSLNPNNKATLPTWGAPDRVRDSQKGGASTHVVLWPATIL